MTLETLRSFSCLAEELHFTRAAKRLQIAQPALTKHIQLLEAKLGVPLFVRDRRSVRLTPEGEILLVKVRRTLDAYADVRGTALRLQRGESGRLRIGFTASAPHHVLPKVMRQFRREHPGIETVLVEAGSSDQLHQLTSGTLDVGIVRPPSECPDGLTLRVLLEEPYVAVLPREHRLARLRTLRLTQLAHEPFVLIARGVVSTVHDQILQACHDAGFTPDVVREAGHIHAVAGLVGAGCGVSVLAASVAHVRLPEVVYRPLVDKGLSTAMALAFPEHHRSPALAAFIATAERALPPTGKTHVRASAPKL